MVTGPAGPPATDRQYPGQRRDNHRGRSALLRVGRSHQPDQARVVPIVAGIRRRDDAQGVISMAVANSAGIAVTICCAWWRIARAMEGRFDAWFDPIGRSIRDSKRRCDQEVQQDGRLQGSGPLPRRDRTEKHPHPARRIAIGMELRGVDQAGLSPASGGVPRDRGGRRHPGRRSRRGNPRETRPTARASEARHCGGRITPGLRNAGLVQDEVAMAL